jgi:hypothetical protein
MVKVKGAAPEQGLAEYVNVHDKGVGPGDGAVVPAVPHKGTLALIK